MLFDRSQRPNTRFLQYVIRIRAAARQPSGKRVCVRKIGSNHGGKLRIFLVAGQNNPFQKLERVFPGPLKTKATDDGNFPPSTRVPPLGIIAEDSMRRLQSIAIVAVLVIGFGTKQIFFSPTKAGADIHVIPSVTMNVLQMHFDHPNPNSLPVERIHDMTFVYSDDDQ
jgi:hypothetical protein